MGNSKTDKAEISVEEVADTLGTTPLNVLLFIKRGQLAGREVGGEWFVERESFAGFLESPAGQKGSAPCRSACSRASHCGTCDQ